MIGHLHLVNSSQLPHIALGALADKYGSAFTIRLGANRGLVVSAWETAKDCFTTNDVAVSSRPKLVAVELMGYNNAMFGFSPYGSYWRELRKISTTHLLSNRRLESLKHVRASLVAASIKDLYKLWKERGNGDLGDNGGLVDMKQWFGNLALDITLQMVVGKRWSDDGASETRHRFRKALRDFFGLVGLFVAGDAIPALKWLDIGGHEKEMKRTAVELDSILDALLEDHHQNKNSGLPVEAGHSFMAILHSVLTEEDFAGRYGYDVRSVNKATCLAILLGGSDTTAVVLTWALSLLLNHPHVMKKVQDELELHVSRNRLVDESEITKLVYLQAVIKETLRLYPAAPLSGQRLFTEDCTVGGYHVARGTWLILNIWKIQRDPRVWDDPTEFKPERFLEAHKDVDVIRGHDFEYLPFGGGRRACPGIALGMAVVNLTLANVLHAFNFSSPGNAPVDMAETYGLTNVKTNPLGLILTPRLPSDAY